MKRTLLAASLMLLASLPGTAGSSGALDPCDLYSKAEATAFAGEDFAKPKTSAHAMGSLNTASCWYRGVHNGWSIKIILDQSDTPRQAAAALVVLTGVGKRTTGNMKPVPGLGEKAYWSQGAPDNGQVHVLVRNTIVTVQTYGKAPGAGTLEKTKQIAAVVVKRFKERK